MEESEDMVEENEESESDLDEADDQISEESKNDVVWCMEANRYIGVDYEESTG